MNEKLEDYGDDEELEIDESNGNNLFDHSIKEKSSKEKIINEETEESQKPS